MRRPCKELGELSKLSSLSNGPLTMMLGESLKIISPTNIKRVTKTQSSKPERKFSLAGKSGGEAGGSSSAYSFQIDMHEYGMPVAKKGNKCEENEGEEVSHQERKDSLNLE